MNAVAGTTRTRPLVAVLYTVPLFLEALDGVFEGIADVHAVPADDSAEALVRWLRPDAIVMDGAPPDYALTYGTEAGIPVVHVSLQEPEVRVHANGTWHVDAADNSPSAIRNAVIAGLVEVAKR